jgi:hypothetical protein
VINTKNAVPLADEGLAPRGLLLSSAPGDDLLLPDIVLAAVGVIEEDGRELPVGLAGSKEVGGNTFDAVEFKNEFLQDEPFTLFLGNRSGADFATPVGEVSQKAFEFGPALVAV